MSEFNIQNYDMDLYTLSPRFYFKYKVERISSFIWTERNSAAGDFQIVMAPTPLWMSILVPGCLVAMRGRRDVMIVENQSFENGLMTITGFGLLKFLNERLAWFKNPDYDADDSGDGEDTKDTDLYADYERDDLKPGQFIADVIDRLCIRPRPFDTPYDDIALDWKRDKFAHLSLGYVTDKGIRKPLSFPNAQPIYDALTALATREHVGIQMYLERANQSTGNYVLRFRTHYGKDRTSSQTDRETVRFTPKLESLIDPKELRSNSEYKNVCYVNYKGKVTVHYAPHVRSAPVGFNRRVTYVDISDKNIKAAKRPAARTRAANAEFRRHLHTHQVDGQVMANLSDYQYGFDYQLGDIVEVEGHSGMIIKARVTEYVRSQDQYGPKVYPTLEVMAESETAYHSEPTFDPDVLDPVYPETPTFASFSSLTSIFGEEAEDDLEFNPFTDPIFEGDDDPFSDPQEEVGDLLDPEQPETVPIISQELTALTPWQVSGWSYDNPVYVPEYETDAPTAGFYVHQGNIYIVGSVSADSSSENQGSDTILSGIPPEYAPDTQVSGKVLIDHASSTLEFCYDSGLKIGPWLDVTINPDGTVTLDDGNPYQPAPGGASPIAGDGNSLLLNISALTWPLNSQYDAYDRDHSLDDWVATSDNVHTAYDGTYFGGDPLPEDLWRNFDGTYSAHDERLHINGKIQKVSEDKTNDLSFPSLVGIPGEFHPQGSTFFPTDDGYLFHIDRIDDAGEKLVLDQWGSQNPQAVDNKGCGARASYFYQRRSDGSLPRGTTPTLSFGRTAYVDDGVEYTGCSGSPVGDLPDIADWRGNVYRADVRFKLEDLVSMVIPPVEDPDYTLVSGDNQLSFVCGIAPGIESYYKVSFTYDPDTELVSVILMLMQCDGINRSVLARHEISPFIQEDGTVQADFSLTVSPRIQDTVYVAPGDYIPVHPGYNFWSFYSTGHSIQGNDYDQTPFVGISVPSGNSKGDMGFHVPLSSKAESLGISGVGEFPLFAPGDTVDFTNCGWPLNDVLSDPEPLTFASRALTVDSSEGEDILTFNPYTDPIFEGDEEDLVQDPQEDVGDLMEPETETVPVTGQGVSDLTPWQVSEWLYDTYGGYESNAGFYVHQGNVYVIGAVSANTLAGNQGSDTLLSGIPPQYAPDTPVSGRVLIDHVGSSLEYAYDSGLKIGPWLDVTIKPDGTVTLDDGNPYLLPPETSPIGFLIDYGSLMLNFSALTWPVSGQIYDSYNRDHSLDDWVDTAWGNLDGTYSAHDERLHLNGKIQKVGSDVGSMVLAGIPLEFQPQVGVVGGKALFPTDDGYLFYSEFMEDESGSESLIGIFSLGAQNPQDTDNAGCGFLAPYFYASRSDGFLVRGSTPTLSFPPAEVDAGVGYTGCSGSPIGNLPDIADWRGNQYHGAFRFRPEDLITMPVPIEGTPDYSPIDYSVVQGENQLSFVCGIASGIESYYKVVFTYDPVANKVSASLLLEQCDGSGRSFLARQEISPFIEEDGTVEGSFTFRVSPRSIDIPHAFTEAVPEYPGYNSWLFRMPGGFESTGSDFDQTPLPEGSGIAVPSGNAKGDMGVHLPLSATSSRMEIEGVGDFPRFAPGDVIDFTNCGWPLYAEEDTVDE